MTQWRMNKRIQTNVAKDSSFDNTIIIRFSDNLNDVIEIHLGSFEGKINAVKVWNKTLSEKQTLVEFKPEMPFDLNSSLIVFVDLDLNYNQETLKCNSLIELKQVS